MVTYALRMPKPILDQLRDVAQARGVTVSALMREWLEERLLSDPEGQHDKGAVRVGELLAFIAERRVVDS